MKYFDSWVLRDKPSPEMIEIFRVAYKNNIGSVRSRHWIFKIFNQFVENNVTISINSRLRRLIKHNKKSNLTLYSYVLKYGKINGKLKFDDYRNKQRNSETREYHLSKGRDPDKLRKSRATTLENMINKHGDIEGKLKFNAYREKQKIAGCSLEWFVDKFGKENGINKYHEVNSKKALTVENFIRKYGEIDGFNKYIAAWANISKGQANSQTAQKLFEKIDNGDEKIYYAKKNHEFNLTRGSKSAYFYDYVDSKRRKIIEYNGDYWHANPEKYQKTDIIHGETAENIRNKDKDKINLAEKRGFSVMIVWHSDYIKDKQNIEEKCNEFLYN